MRHEETAVRRPCTGSAGGRDTPGTSRTKDQEPGAELPEQEPGDELSTGSARCGQRAGRKRLPAELSVATDILEVGPAPGEGGGCPRGVARVRGLVRARHSHGWPASRPSRDRRWRWVVRWMGAGHVGRCRCFVVVAGGGWPPMETGSGAAVSHTEARRLGQGHRLTNPCSRGSR